jgi:hypothetical protein
MLNPDPLAMTPAAATIRDEVAFSAIPFFGISNGRWAGEQRA